MAEVNKNKPAMNADMEEISMNTTVLVIGGGWNGIKVASELVHAGFPGILVDSEQDMSPQVFPEHLMATSEKELADLLETVKNNKEIEVLTSSQVLSLGGAPGDFHVRLEQDGNVLERRVGAVVVALEAQKIPMAREYGLDGHDKALSQSDIELVLASDEKKKLFLEDGDVLLAYQFMRNRGHRVLPQ